MGIRFFTTFQVVDCMIRKKKKKKNGKECKVFMVRVSALYDKGNYSEFLQGS